MSPPRSWNVLLGKLIKPRQCPSCILIAAVVLLSAIIVVWLVIDLQARYRDAIADAKTTAQQFADVLAEHTERTFEGVERALDEADQIRRLYDAGVLASGHEAESELRRVTQTSPVIVAIGWTNRDGDLIVQSRDTGTSRGNIGSLPYFVAQRDNQDRGLLVAAPYISALTGNWVTSASRRITTADGEFAGIIRVVLDPSYFSSTYRAIVGTSDTAVLLIHRAGPILVREPFAQSIIGKSVSDGPLLREGLPKSDAGSLESISPINGGGRIAGYRAVRNLPLVVLVSYARAQVLAPWYRNLYVYGSVAALKLIIILAGAILLARRTNALVKAKGNIEDANSRFSVQNMRFKAALNNMGDGLCMFDAEATLVVCNDRFGRMYNLPPDLLQLGTPHRDIVAFRIKAGVLAGDTSDLAVEQKIEALNQLPRNAPSSRIEELANGRLIRVTRRPLEGGGWVGTHEDVTDRHRQEAKISFMAHHDLLTGLPNRAFFAEKMEDAVARFRRHREPFSVFMLDLDKFKNVNDSLGHPAGDQLLKETAERLRASLRETDVLARLGGDEFAIIQSGEEDQREGAAGLASRIASIISEPYYIDGTTVSVGTSIGIGVASDAANDSTTLLKMADLALYRAKAEGRNGFRFFDSDMLAETDNRRIMEAELRGAISRCEFELYYQPLVAVSTRRTASFEALVRWHHPERGLILPDQFIPLAEETGLIRPLGEWILQQACADAAKWPAHLKVAVNMSPVQLAQPNLLQIVLCALVESSLAPERLELEITETALFEGDVDYVKLIRQIKSIGVSIALDDFGTGYSSLSYLTMFPFDMIKIDRSFTLNLTKRSDCAAIVSAVLALGRGLEIQTAAEGVETEQQFGILRAAGVTFVQGNLFGVPRPVSALVLDESDTVAGINSAA